MNENFLSSREGLLKLTQDVRTFSEALTALKVVFLQNTEIGEAWLIEAHKQLGELLKVLKMVVDKYNDLDSHYVLSAATTLIKHIKEFDYEDKTCEGSPEIFRAINNLAMTFSNSVSESLTGEQTTLVTNEIPEKTSSNENAGSSNNLNAADEDEEDVLYQVDDGVEIALERAKILSKYLQDLLFYVKKKASLEIQHANNLMKLCSQVKPSLTEQSFLPFQSLYCTAIDNVCIF